MTEEVKRIPIYKYRKSGKHVAITYRMQTKKYTYIDLTPDLKEMKKIRIIKYMEISSLENTKYFLEAIENIEQLEGDEYSLSYEYLRVLTTGDLNEEKWKNTKCKRRCNSVPPWRPGAPAVAV